MSARPGRVKGVFRIPFERPRTLRIKRDPRFLEIEDAIWQMVEEHPADRPHALEHPGGTLPESGVLRE
jgi:NitT/TauT family transport system ATP-binding protein